MSSKSWELVLSLSTWALCIGAWDLMLRRIPNLLSLGVWPVAALPLVMSGHTWSGTPWAPALWTTGAATLAGLPAYALGKLGAGDVKLMVAIALLTSPIVFAISYAVAGLLALGLLGVHAVRRHGALIGHAYLEKLASLLLDDARNAGANVRMPFGTLLCAGLLVALQVSS